MNDFEGNSHASKQTKKKLEKVNIQGGTVTKKESALKKSGISLIENDFRTSVLHILKDVVLPNTRQSIADAICSLARYMFTGDKSVKSSSGISGVRNISYYNMSKNQPVQPSSQTKGVYAVDEVRFDNRGDAEEVLLRLKEVIADYGVVTVGDYYDILPESCGLKANFTDFKYGWRDLLNAEVVRTNDDRYTIRFPKIIVIES